jgi:succinate-acetate transporter protein
MAVGNTFGATALSFYRGFWISFAIVLTLGGFEIVSSIEATGDTSQFLNSSIHSWLEFVPLFAVLSFLQRRRLIFT